MGPRFPRFARMSWIIQGLRGLQISSKAGLAGQAEAPPGGRKRRVRYRLSVDWFRRVTAGADEGVYPTKGHRKALRVDSSTDFSESTGMLRISGLTIHPSAAGVSLLRVMEWHSNTTPPFTCSKR